VQEAETNTVVFYLIVLIDENSPFAKIEKERQSHSTQSPSGIQHFVGKDNGVNIHPAKCWLTGV